MSGSIWWTKMSGAGNFIKDIVDAIANDGQSVIIDNAQTIPFFDEFCCEVEDNLREILYNKNLESFYAEKITDDDIAKFMAKNYCGEDTYFPKTDYGAVDFLSTSRHFCYKNSVLMVRNIPANHEKHWIEFVQKYSKLTFNNIQKAQFILLVNTDKTIKQSKCCRVLSFSDYAQEYDYYIYCQLIMAQYRKNSYSTAMKQYIAEVSALLCKDDIELCSLLLENPEKLMNCTCEYYNSCCGKNLSENVANTILWQAQIKYLFPVLEQYRCSLVKQYSSFLKQFLPLDLVYGGKISEVQELELGHLLNINNQKKEFLNNKEKEKLSLYKEIRDKLAHMKPTDIQNVKSCLIPE